jgi:hypothetical protein
VLKLLEQHRERELPGLGAPEGEHVSEQIPHGRLRISARPCSGRPRRWPVRSGWR